VTEYVQINNFICELFKKNYFYFLFTKFELHNISLVSTFILGGSQLTSYTTDLLGCKNGLLAKGRLSNNQTGV